MNVNWNDPGFEGFAGKSPFSNRAAGKPKKERKPIGSPLGRTMLNLLVTQLAERNGVTERLKAENQMEWVRQMNLCRSQAEEVVLSDLIYS